MFDVWLRAAIQRSIHFSRCGSSRPGPETLRLVSLALSCCGLIRFAAAQASVQVRATDGAEMVFVPAGSFAMGTSHGYPCEGPVHKVTLGAFYIDRYEVTNSQYMKFVRATGHALPPFIRRRKYRHPLMPVVGVSWNDAVAYCKWAKASLPTEAEWERAAKGLSSRIYPWGDAKAPFTCNAFDWRGAHNRLMLVGSFPAGASPCGALDMAGNVMEWCADWYSADYYRVSPKVNPQGPPKGTHRVVRGGGWTPYDYRIRVTDRDGLLSSSKGRSLGFRCVVRLEVRQQGEAKP